MVQMPKWFVALVALVILVGLATPVMADEAKGKIKSVTADKMTFVATDKDGKDWTFQMADGGKVTLADKEIKLKELKVGDEVTITYEKKGTDLIAKEIKVERK
jgi:hypothetical protein